MYPSIKDAPDDCYFNLRLSMLVVGYGVAGTFLMAYSLRVMRRKVPKTFKKTSALLFPGILLR